MFGKRWGEKPEWRKAGQDRSPGAKPHVWVLVPQSMEIPHPLVQGLSVYRLREGSCQAWEIYNMSFQPWSMWNKWKPTKLNVCPVLLYEAQELSHHSDKLYRIKIEGGAGGTQQWGREGQKMWEMARKPQKGSRLHNPALEPRVWKSQHWPKYLCCPKSNCHITSLGFLPWPPEWALLTKPSRIVSRKAFYRGKSALHKYKGVLLTIRLSYPLQFGFVFLEYGISVGEK